MIKKIERENKMKFIRNLLFISLIFVTLFLSPVFSNSLSTNYDDYTLVGNMVIPNDFDEVISEHMVQDNLDLLKTRDGYVSSSVPNTKGTAPTSGVVNIPVLFVDFPDVSFDSEIPLSIFNDALNGNNYLNGNGKSVKKYIESQSNYNPTTGEGVTVNFVIHPTVRTLPQTMSYYRNLGAGQSVVAVANAAIQIHDPFVDFSQYDSDNDGRIDGFLIIRAGTASQVSEPPPATVIWKTSSMQVDGKYYGNAALVPQKLSAIQCMSMPYYYNHPDDCRISITVIAHEFMHVFGLPDLYEICNGNQQSMGLSNATMMATSYPPNNPISLDAWSRFFLGWTKAKDVFEQDEINFNVPAATYGNDVYVLRNQHMNNREFFLVSNRYIAPGGPDHGILYHPQLDIPSQGGIEIYHIDEQYISQKYPINEIMCDLDGDYYTGPHHPGIRFERSVTTNTHSHNLYYVNFYFNGPPFVDGVGVAHPLNIFDEIERTSSQITYDATSKSYNGNDTYISLETSSPGGINMPAVMKTKPTTPAPTSSHDSGYYTTPQDITLLSDVGADIYYTTNGSVPTLDSTLYTTPIHIGYDTSMTIRAIAQAENSYTSFPVTFTYHVTGAVADIVADLEDGAEIYVGTSVSLTTPTTNAAIRYTLDGSEPSINSPIYHSPRVFTEIGDITLKAKAFLYNWDPSETLVIEFSVLALPENKILDVSFEEGLAIVESNIDHDQNIVTISVPYRSVITNLTLNLELSDGASLTHPSGPQNFYNNPIAYTIVSLIGDERTYVVSVDIKPAVEPVTFSLESGSYVGPQEVSLSTETHGALIRYTLDGTLPYLNSSAYVGNPISITEDTVLTARAFKFTGPEIHDIRANATTPSVRLVNDYTPTGMIWLISLPTSAEYIIHRNLPVNSYLESFKTRRIVSKKEVERTTKESKADTKESKVEVKESKADTKESKVEVKESKADTKNLKVSNISARGN